MTQTRSKPLGRTLESLLLSTFQERLIQATQPVEPKEPLTFEQFIRQVNPRFKFYRHTLELIKVLQRVADDQITRLMVFMPPRHSKSETTSRLFSAYYLYRHPDRWVGLNSFGSELANTLSRNSRDHYLASGGSLTVEGVQHWETGKGGGLWAAGVGGPITGKGFHLGIIDDPLKNAKQAASAKIREDQKDWFRSTFLTREEPGAAIVVIQTRWHEDDLSGWLLSQETAGDDDEEDRQPEDWTILYMPAILEDKRPTFPANCRVLPDPDPRRIGDALCPERYPLPKLLKRKRRLGSYFWNAIYQQAPQPPDGEIFKRHHWRYWQPAGFNLPPVPVVTEDGSLIEIPAVTLPDRFDEQLQSWDCSFKDKTTSDFVAGQVWGRVKADKFLLAYFKKQVDINKTMQQIRIWHEEYPKAYAKLIEDAANGPAIIQILGNDIPGIIGVSPEGGKLARAQAIAPGVEAGNYYLPHPSLYAWVDELIGNAAGFPNVAHDDDIDAMTQAGIRMTLYAGWARG